MQMSITTTGGQDSSGGKIKEAGIFLGRIVLISTDAALYVLCLCSYTTWKLKDVGLYFSFYVFLNEAITRDILSLLPL